MKEKNHMIEYPNVTVVILTYNRADIIEKSIQSVIDQTLYDWKLLIIDDGSTDNTSEVIKKYTDKDSRILYHKMDENKGTCHGWNEALKVVNTKYMVQLDSDDRLERHSLELLVNTMEQTSDKVAMAYGNYKIWVDNESAEIVKARSFTNKEKYELLTYKPSLYPRCYRVECLRKVGGWDINNRYNGRFMEDRIIMFKLIENYDFLCIDDYLYNLNRSINDKQLTTFSNREKYRKQLKDYILFYLERWGNEYTAKFTENEYGWLDIELKPSDL